MTYVENQLKEENFFFSLALQENLTANVVHLYFWDEDKRKVGWHHIKMKPDDEPANQLI